MHKQLPTRSNAFNDNIEVSFQQMCRFLSDLMKQMESWSRIAGASQGKAMEPFAGYPLV